MRLIIAAILTVLASLGLVAATIYSLWIIQRIFHGPNKHNLAFSDLSIREMAIMGMMIIAIVWIGLFPQPVLNTAEQFLKNLGLSMTKMRVAIPRGTAGNPQLPPWNSMIVIRSGKSKDGEQP